jgi:transposase
MAKKKEISSGKRHEIIFLHQEGHSNRKISEKVNLPPSTVGYIVRKYRNEGLVEGNRDRPGRPKKTSERIDRIIVRKVKANRKETAGKIAAAMEEEFNVKVCPQTVRNRIRETGLKGRIARKKTFISLKNKKARVKFGKEHISKDLSFWKTILFSDESKFNLHGSDGKGYVWRKVGEELNPKCMKGTVKHGGGNVKVWGCFSYDGVGELVFIDGIMTSLVYRNILEENLQKSAKKLFKRKKWIYQQDNDPKHTSHVMRNYFAEKKISLLEWPSQSPDLNPIEHLWDAMEKATSNRRCSNVQELKMLLLEAWNNLAPQVLHKLVESMPRRCEAVLKSKGWPTKY